MKKDRIEITKANNTISFYLVSAGQRHWLFSQEYSMSVYKFFREGRSLSEVRKHNCWRSNRRLAKTIDRIPGSVDAVRKKYELPATDGKRRYYSTTYRDIYAV